MAASKGKKQLMMLGGLVVVIIGVAIYANREALIPESTSAAPIIPSVTRRPLPPEDAYDELFESAVFKSLKAFGDVPVTPGKMGNNDPFSEFQE